MKSGDDSIKWKGNGKQHTNEEREKNKAVINISQSHAYIHVFKCKHFKHFALQKREGHEEKQGKVCSLYIERNTDKEGDSMRMREG